MNEQEKILLLQLILEDIRGNWAFYQEERIDCAKDLARELLHIENMNFMLQTIETYDLEDGRYFRDNYPYGYYGMESLHNLRKTINDKSEEFQQLAKAILTYPECRFEDWVE